MPDSHIHAAHQADVPVDETSVDAIAQTMQALPAPSRIRLLYALRDGELTVSALASAAGRHWIVEQSDGCVMAVVNDLRVPLP